MILALLLAIAVPADEFFIVSSVDLPRSRLVLKRPTEVTVLAAISPQTRIVGERGEKLRPEDLRAGDTVFVVSAPSPSGQLTAISVRRGPMIASTC